MANTEAISSLREAIETEDSDLIRAAGLVNNLLYYFTGRTEWSELAGLDILDLGCGSEMTPRIDRHQGWPPYFSRLCAACGASVVGIDLYPSLRGDKEKYCHIVADLVPLVVSGGLTELLSGRRFDGVNLSSLGGQDWWNSLTATGKNETSFKSALIRQAPIILKEDGVLMIDDEAYQYVQGSLNVLE